MCSSLKAGNLELFTNVQYRNVIKHRVERGPRPQQPNQPRQVDQMSTGSQEQCLPWCLSLLYPWSLQAGLVNTATHMLEEHRKNQMQGFGLSVNSRHEDTLEQLLPGQ